MEFDEMSNSSKLTRFCNFDALSFMELFLDKFNTFRAVQLSNRPSGKAAKLLSERFNLVKLASPLKLRLFKVNSLLSIFNFLKAAQLSKRPSGKAAI